MATSKSVAEADPVVERAREELMQLETEVENVEKELVKQQNRLLKPIWEKRKAILSKIPDFWSVAIGNHPVLAPLISYEDVEILNHLTSLHVDRNDDNPENYRITVTFSKNAYFKDTELVKTFKQSKDGESFASKTLINWYDGKDLTKKRKNMDDERQGSFFEWFADEGPDLGDVIRDDLFPEALRYYYMEVEDDETDDINAEFDLDDTDDEEDGDEDEDDEPPQKKGKRQ